MKNFMMILVAAMMVATSGKAENANNNIEAANEAQANAKVNYRFRVHINDMRKQMHLEEAQVEEVQAINRELSRRIKTLETTPVEFRRAKLTAIMSENLASMHKVVTSSQYHVYLSLLNNEFNKAGLNTILYDYEVAMN